MEIHGPRPSRHAKDAPRLTEPRARVLESLQQRTAAVSADELAAEFGQHVNTVRGHLEFLASQGLAVRENSRGPGRGRPTSRYRANPMKSEADPRVREYGALASALAGHIMRTSPHPAEDAFAAGFAWGTNIAESSGHPEVPPQVARRRVIAILDDLGFEPQPMRRGTAITLRQCPLLDVAQQYPDIVCEVHRGLVAGAFDVLGGEPDDVELLPFGASDGCVLDLHLERA